MNREEHDDEDHAPVEVGRRPRARVRDGFAMNEADDRMRRQAERAIGMHVLRRVELVAVAGASAPPASASRTRPCADPERIRSQARRCVSRSHHTISASRILAAPLRKSQSGLPSLRPPDRAHDVGAAVEQQHDAGRHHQAAERERGLKRDQRAGEHREDAAAVMRAAAVGIPRVGQLDDAGEKDGDADDRHAPDRREERRDHGDRAEHEQTGCRSASR